MNKIESLKLDGSNYGGRNLPFHPHCEFCEGQEHCWHPEMNDDQVWPYMACRHCTATREMTQEEEEADWR